MSAFVVDNLLDFKSCGYSDIEVLLPYQMEESDDSIKRKIVFEGSIKDCYEYYWENRNK
jgi:hypothetical protein